MTKRGDMAKWLIRQVPIPLAVQLARRWPRLSYHLPPGHRMVADRYLGHCRMLVDTTYFVERQILCDCYEPELRGAIRRLIRRGDFAIDVGANVGAITMILAEAVGPTGRVWAFEPGPLVGRLRENLEMNPHLGKVVKVEACGLSDQGGTLFWKEDPSNLGNAGLEMSGEVAVPVVTLDAYCDRAGIERLDFIKIDVEGMEPQVLQGGLLTIARFKPILVFETLDACLGQGARGGWARIESMLAGIGYQLHRWSGGRFIPASEERHDAMTFAVHHESKDLASCHA